MDRRTFIKRSAIASAAVVGPIGLGWLVIEKHEHPLTIEQAIDTITAWNTDMMLRDSPWSLAQVFMHCAQSIDYSIDGYPQQKPQWFKQSIGQVAFQAFDSKGKMHHNLSEPIPGAPFLRPDIEIAEAKALLIDSLKRFAAHQGAFQPHFAYGSLDKQQYERAHVMHINNHLLPFNIVMES